MSTIVYTKIKPLVIPSGFLMFVVEERESTDSAFVPSELNRSLVGGGRGPRADDE